MRILYVVTDARSVSGLLRAQLVYLSNCGYQVAVASNPGPGLFETGEELGIQVFPVEMKREISPIADLRALIELSRIMRSWKPEVVNSGTPKAGLLGTLAAWMAGVRNRYYVLRGLRLETEHGLKGGLLSLAERAASNSATRIIAVSDSLRRAYVNRGLAPASKIIVLGVGSSQGVDSSRFDPAAFDRDVVRESMGIPSEDFVIGFVGRLSRDKGVVELLDSFESVLERIPESRLLLVGRFEGSSSELRERAQASSRILLSGQVSDPRPLYAAMDLFVFPSHREGFPNVVLEASAMAKPIVAAKATGTVDAIVDGVTGALVPIGDSNALTSAIRAYAEDPSRMKKHGVAGRAWVSERFERSLIFDALDRLYREDLEVAISSE